jgi:hypothetical protein
MPCSVKEVQNYSNYIDNKFSLLIMTLECNFKVNLNFNELLGKIEMWNEVKETCWETGNFLVSSRF